MATGIGLSIDTSFLKSLELADKKLQDLMDKTNTLSRATLTAFQQMAKQGVTPYIEQLKQQKRALEEVGNISVKGGASSALTQMKKDAKATVDEINKIIQALERTKAYRGEQSGRGALSFANSVLGQRGEPKSIDNLRKALSDLEAAQNRQNLNTKRGRQNYEKLGEAITKVQGELDKLDKGHKALLGTSDKLAKALSAAFSLAAIRGYVSQLINVRKEFELQQRSLEAIIKNKDEADKLWDKTIALAVKSPFTVRQLVRYTKELAAYRVESEKLYETNKMLADVSAGLGVDMERLILAYGQVKAASYLRGTELRQFTEAGIPMLEELSKYFSEVEGRAISVGDVFDMVSKRMVAFEDVNEVFKRMTSEGGTFYRMQEIQAETLHGQWTNLADALDIMMNEIGESQEGILKGSVSFLRNLVENWRELATVLKIIVPAYGALKVSSLLTSQALKTSGDSALWFHKGLGLTMTSASKAQLSLKGLTLKHKALSVAQYLGVKGALALQGALMSLGAIAKSALPLLAIGALTTLYSNLTASSREAKRLKKELEDIYNEDTSNLKSQVRGFESLVGRLRDVNKGSDEHKEIIQKLNSQYGEYLGYIVDEKTTYDQLASSIDSVTLALKRKAKMNTFEKAYAATFSSTTKEINELRDELEEGFLKRMKDSSGLALVPNESEINDIFGLIEERVRETGDTISDYDSLNEIISEYYKEDITLSGQNISNFTKLSKLYLKQKEAELELDKEINSLYEDRSRSSLEARQAFDDLEKRRKEALEGAKGAPAWEREAIEKQFEREKIALEVRFEGLDKGVAALREEALEESNVTIKDVNKKIIEASERLGEKYANMIYIDSSDSQKGISNIAEETASAYKTQQEIIEHQNALKDAGTDYEKDILENAKQAANAYYYKLQLLGRLDLLQDKSTKGESKELQLLKQQLSAIKESSQTYQGLRKDFSDTTSMEKTASAFKDLFQELVLGEVTTNMSFDERGILAVLDKLPNLAGEAGRKAIEKLRAEFLGKLDVETQQALNEQIRGEVEGLFDQYELSLELKKLNIPPDLAKSLFNIDYLDLDALRSAIEARVGEFSSKDMEEAYKGYLKRVEELSRKAQEDEAKEFVNFLKKNLDEIQVIQDKGAYNIALADRLFGEGKITEEQYLSSIRQIVADTNKEVGKVNLERFKDSATYIKAMGNLAAYSRVEIQGMLNTLKQQVGENAGNMQADEIEAYYDAISRLVEQYDKLESPFQKGEINDLIEYLNLQKQLNQEKEKEVSLEQRKAEINNRLNLLQALLKSQKKSGDVLGAASTQEQIKSAVSELKEVDGQLVGVASNILVISERVEALGDGMVKSLAVAHKIVNEIANVANAATKIFDDVKSAADALGADTESGGWAKAGIAMDMVGGVSSELTEGLSNLASGNFVGAIANVVGMVTKLISGFSKLHDQNFQEIIEAQAKKVERLSAEYEKLEGAVNEAYSLQQLQHYNSELEKNVELQIASYKAMIAAEEAKKDSDTEQIEAWNDEIEALNGQLSDLKKNLLEGVGGVTNFRSQTRGFVDAWASAFKETGNGLSGLKDNFREFFDNIIAEQAALRVVDGFLAPFYNSINEALKDYALTAEESQDLREEADAIMPELSKALELIWNNLGGSRGGTSGGLSALEKGVQDVTEQTAQVIEALLNSMRFYIADSNNELKAQTKYMRDLYNLLNGMTATHPSLGGRGIKVVM